jgi:glycosyltransferase involved in cell wall biosynthesis
MINTPLVSVVCLCYDQERWLEEAVQSVINQSYKNIQLIVADDASTDNSASKIAQLKERYPAVEVLLLPVNKGNCAAFNEAYKKVKGDFVIDFAADDVMLPDRIEKQIDFFNTLDSSYGIVFSNADYIDAEGKFIRNHFNHLFKTGLLNKIPEGDVYADVLARYFIPSPTMMVKREVFDKIGGYDESLVYEDFDFWVRTSRFCKYGFLNDSLTKIRRTGSSMSSGLYKRGDKQLHSTYLVCKKAIEMNRNEKEKKALLKRIRYELRQSIFSENHKEASLFYRLLNELDSVSTADRILELINSLKLPTEWLRRLYHSVRFK